MLLYLVKPYRILICSQVSQIPKLDFLLDKNPVKRVGPPPLLWATITAYKSLAERKAESPSAAESRSKDFLDHFLEAAARDPKLVDDNMVVTYLLSNVLAGSDTTGIYMIAALYYILKTPGVVEKLQQELKEHRLGRQPVSWKATQSMPYFDAIMKEASRIHPGVGIMIERDVPAEGFRLPDGRFLPGGTVIGMNPWLINRSEEYFGSETDKFVPERWLKQEGESNTAFEARRARMKAADLTFGAGSRICLGRNIAIFQAYKTVATLFNLYDVSLRMYVPMLDGRMLTLGQIKLAEPEKEWTIHNSWFTYQYDVKCILTPKA